MPGSLMQPSQWQYLLARGYSRPEIGVGIAANAVNASGTNISFTLIDGLDENGFTGMASEEYEFRSTAVRRNRYR